jgi:hypothetical protein
MAMHRVRRIGGHAGGAKKNGGRQLLAEWRQLQVSGWICHCSSFVVLLLPFVGL